MTIYDIARLADVSASTVSRVIGNKPGVKAETRNKVQKILKDCDFSINETASGLARHSSKLVGIVMADIRMVHHNTAAYVIECELTKRGYYSTILNTGTEMERKLESIRSLRQRRVEAAVFLGSSFQDEMILEQIEKYIGDIPVVMLNSELDLPNVYSVMMGEYQGVEDCVRFLARKNRKRIVMVSGTYTIGNMRKQEGYIQCMKALELTNEIHVYGPCDGSPDSGYSITKKILRDFPATNAIIYAYDSIATGGIRAIHENNRRIPEDISVIGIDNTIYSLSSYPTMTALDTKIEDIAYIVARQVQSLLEGRVTPKRISVPAVIVERNTT